MEPNGTNQNRTPTVLQCRMGCGFYGSVANDGMCSKCYKDLAKSGRESSLTDKINGQSAACNSEGTGGQTRTPVRDDDEATPVGDDDDADLAAGICTAIEQVSISSQADGGDGCEDSTSDSQSSFNNDSTAAAAAASGGAGSDSDLMSTSTASASFPATTEDCDDLTAAPSLSGSASPSKPKKNRCHTCSKRVGLTGFQCRCGGLYCGMHRYSDTHGCSFNYKELGQEDIRKNNPVVVSEKVKKI